MKYETRPPLLRAAADSIEMQDATGVEPVCMCDGQQRLIKNAHFLNELTVYEFPLAVVEGRQVWAGDRLWCGDMEIIADHTNGNSIYTKNGAFVFLPNPHLSWSPPKPVTVMVELSVEDAEYWEQLGSMYSKSRTDGVEDKYLIASNKFFQACRKALEEMK